MNKNKYGLSRDIPEEVKRSVRQRCGFGCAVCGSAIYEYHHFAPEFSEAKKHDSDGILLLCPGCHGKIGKGLLSAEKVNYSASHPKCQENGEAKEALEFNSEGIIIKLGGNTIIGTPIIFRIFGRILLRVDPPEREEGPCRLSGHFYDNNEKETCVIINNEIVLKNNAWDITWEGQRVAIRSESKMVVFQAQFNPPKLFHIERLNMVYRGWRTTVDNYGTTKMYLSWLPGDHLWHSLNNITFRGGNEAFRIDEERN